MCLSLTTKGVLLPSKALSPGLSGSSAVLTCESCVHGGLNYSSSQALGQQFLSRYICIVFPYICIVLSAYQVLSSDYLNPFSQQLGKEG